MKELIILMLVINILKTNGDDCRCSVGYAPTKADGKSQCFGLNNRRLIPCIPSPHCKCSENAIKVYWGEDGVFCAESFNNRTRIRPCANKEDWKKFRNKLKEKV